MSIQRCKQFIFGAASLLLFVACGNGTDSAMVSIMGSHSVSMGETLYLIATTVDGTDSGYVWSTDDSTIATVNATGAVSPVAPGETMVMARGIETDAVGQHPLVVVSLGQAVVLLSANVFVQVGGSSAITATTVNGVDATYTFSSSDERVAIVDSAGLVTGHFGGSVTINATGDDSGGTGSIDMVVVHEIPNHSEWLSSGHSDITAEAFNHWNEDDPAEVPVSCAKCHATPGFLDFIGADGSAPGVVDGAVAVGTVIECRACHNETANALSSVVFPSLVEVNDLGPEARCMTCHQGRASADSVEQAIADAGITDPDTPSSSLGFQNIHYFAAGATLYAGRVRGGYQYAGDTYDWRFRHVPGRDTCVGCHDPHSLEVRVADCTSCHADVATLDDVKDIRMIASVVNDYDGDGDTTEGLYHEIAGLKSMLLSLTQDYVVDKGMDAICYDAAAYPYWFIDSNSNDVCEVTEAAYPNRYASWTARLLRAAYNYQVAEKDPGAFAHNGKYIIQLLYDSAHDLNAALTTPIDLSTTERNDPGHFDGASEAARHWDGDVAVSASCSTCHGGSDGFRFYLDHGVGVAVDAKANGLDCFTCHDDFGSTYATVAVDSVLYPSGLELAAPGDVSNICSTCHSGRESKATIDAAISKNSFGFRNVHYLPAAAVKKGVLAQVGYEYTGQTYAGERTTHPGGDGCPDCHNPVASNHSFQVVDSFSTCQLCHSAAIVPDDIRGLAHMSDYDGDGVVTESLADEVAGLASATLAEIQVYASGTGPSICYDAHAYPYFFIDTNNNAVCESDEANYGNRFTAWTPALMKAAHNVQISQKEPGAWAHNFDYMAQLLIDSIQDLGGNVSMYVRP